MHEEHLRREFHRLQEHKLFARLSKCGFDQARLPCLGHVVGADAVQVDPDKPAAIDSWPTPWTLPESLRTAKLPWALQLLQAVHTGLCQQDIATERPEEKRSLVLHSEEHEQAIQWVDSVLQRAPILALPASIKPFLVKADASGLALGAVLTQIGRSVAYESRALNPAEKTFLAGEQGLLAVVHALKGSLTGWRAAWASRASRLRIRARAGLAALHLHQGMLSKTRAVGDKSGSMHGVGSTAGSTCTELHSQIFVANTKMSLWQTPVTRSYTTVMRAAFGMHVRCCVAAGAIT